MTGAGVWRYLRIPSQVTVRRGLPYLDHLFESSRKGLLALFIEATLHMVPVCDREREPLAVGAAEVDCRSGQREGHGRAGHHDHELKLWVCGPFDGDGAIDGLGLGRPHKVSLG